MTSSLFANLAQNLRLHNSGHLKAITPKMIGAIFLWFRNKLIGTIFDGFEISPVPYLIVRS